MLFLNINAYYLDTISICSLSMELFSIMVFSFGIYTWSQYSYSPFVMFWMSNVKNMLMTELLFSGFLNG